MGHIIIGIDAVNIRRGGGRTHLIELLNAADPVRDGFSVIYVWGSRETLQTLPRRSWIRKEWSPALDGNLMSRTFWQKFALSKAARKVNCDVLFIPGGSFSTDFRPVLVMSQNILPFEWRELWRYGFSLMTLKLALLRFTQAISFRKADAVIFVSDYGRQGVLQVTGVLPGETRVIRHGLNPRFLVSYDRVTQKKPPARGEPIRCIYVSIIDQYKHQWNVVEALAKARLVSGLDLQLDLIGPSYAPALRRLNAAIAEHDPYGEWVCYHEVVDYQQLHLMYQEANIGIWASTCETFGLILLEMMGAGLPVLSSNRGPMPEILGDAGLYFDPEKSDSLSAALLELLASDEKMIAFVRAAHQKAEIFSWGRCAAETFAFLCRIAEMHRRAG